MAKIKLHFQRFEFKYQLSLDVVEGIVPELLKYMDYDPYSKNVLDNAYRVSSLYFDSHGLGCYRDKLAGLRTRKKLRLRFYDSQLDDRTPVFLEIKRKYDNVVVKDRLPMRFQECKNLIWKNIIPQNVNAEQRATLNEFLWLKTANCMIPQNMVMYRRKPFISKVDPGFRVTIDSHLETFLTDRLQFTGHKSTVQSGTAVIEVKFNNILPAWFQDIIHNNNLEQKPFSKYCSALEACHPYIYV